MAVGAMSALQDMGVDVPNEVAVTGFDDVQLSRYLQPTLTTVRQPMRELGELAIQLLVERLEKPGAANTSMILPTRLVLRQSCGCPGDASVLGAVVGGAPYLEVLKSEGR